MISKRVGCCSLLSLLPLLASLPNLLLLLLRVLILPCPSSSLSLDTTTTTTTTNTEPTTFDTKIPTTTSLQEDDWLHVLTDQDSYDYGEDDYWLLNQTNCFPSDTSHDQSPKKDTVDFHDVRKQIVEHVFGEKELSDPEHLRLRALAAWRYQGRQWVVVNGGPLFLTPRLGAFDGMLQESEESVDAVVEENIDGNRTMSEANVEQENGNETEEDEGRIEVNGEDSKDAVEEISDGKRNEEQKEEAEERETGREDDDNSTLVSIGENDISIEENVAYNNTEGGEGSTNEHNERTNSSKREKIEEVSDERETQELEIQDRRRDALVDEQTTGISEVTVEEGTRLRLVCNVSGVKHIWVSEYIHAW
ncbi:hypothetical protein E2C01_072012 [Portunus trituberculatus]|uniref:Uncharacterized protein n=1 Tax=Portunus trituberculatus TaxID=210409 RepID=A0A5B7I609_PORTR|nr:hypothetical protein [Portunus trituberculatus]